jgi:hypothetical protein
MATVAVNNIVRGTPKSVFESAKALISSAVSWNQGDLLWLDASAHLIKPVAAVANALTFLGVARQTIVSGVVKSPYIGTAVDAAVAIEDIAGPAFGVSAKLIMATGVAFNPGDPIYPTVTDAQHVTTTDPTSSHIIGYYVGPAVASAAAGQVGEFFIGCVYNSGMAI